MITIGIYSDIFYTNKKSAISKISSDLEFYFKEYGFNIKHIKNSFDTLLDEISQCDIVIGVPEICTLKNVIPNITDDDIQLINKKVIPIWHHYPLTQFDHFKHLFIHNFWTEEFGYTNEGIANQIDKLAHKYKKVYLPIGINTMKYYPTRKINKIKKIGFVGKLSNINNPDASSWCLNKRPNMFLDIAKKSGLDWVSISETENSKFDDYRLYNDIDLIICTSVEEGNPMGLLESIACKIPFISTKVGLTLEYSNIKTFNTVDEALTLINEFNSSEFALHQYIETIYNEIIPKRDWSNIIPKYWLPYVIKKYNMKSHNNQILNLVSLLMPYNIYQSKLRLGSNRDGGYVITDHILNQSGCLFTYGVGDNIDFELDFIKLTNKKCKLFDHTINGSFIDNYVSITNGLLSFYNEGLGNDNNCKSFEHHYKQLQINEEVLLKIDVEGCEYDYFETADIDFIKNTCNCILLEIHNIEDLQTQSRLITILQKINKHFMIFHIHGNNYSTTFKYKNFEIPNALELSFINKKYVQSYEKYKDYSLTYLDFPNDSNQKDLSLNFLQILAKS